MNQSNSLSRPRHARARYIACVGMLTAVCYVVTLVCKLIPPVQGILSFDLKDAVAVIGAFIFGPIAGLALALLPSLLEFLTYSGTGPVGLLMNVLSTAAFVLPAAILYKRSSSLSIPFSMPYFKLFYFQLSKSMPFLMQKGDFPSFLSESYNEVY